MLTPLIKKQLVIFTIAALIGMGTMVFGYLQVPGQLGIGRITVTVELANSGGLYRFSNVTYRGVQVGRVTGVRATHDGAAATLSLDATTPIPADLQAAVLSVSAIGEQYVDLRPRTDSAPYLVDGSVIPRADTTVPAAVGPMLDKLSALVESVPQGRISGLLDETHLALDGAGYDLGSLFDSSSTLAAEMSGAAPQVRALIDDSRPLLDGQAQSGEAIRTWARSVAGVSGQLAADDARVRTVLRTGPDSVTEVSRLLAEVKPTLPVLLANLATLGQVAVTYNASLEQILVLLPPYIASNQALGLAKNNPTGMALLDATLSTGDPPACTVGFLPPSSWRSPADLSDIDTPDGLYCKLPQDSPIGVRGARNYPCMGQPGKRAPTVQICESDQPYQPLAMRQHALGPYPIDPNLIAQGIPPDDRVDFGDQIFGPPSGTPVPPGQAPPGVTPNALRPDSSGQAPAAVAPYDPATGQYTTADGQVFRQTDLSGGAPESWQELFPK